MHIYRFSHLDELASYAEAWDRLAAGGPFRSWAWMSSWWTHYGQDRSGTARIELFVLAVFDEADCLVGLAPWYRQPSGYGGHVLHWLGSGEVCSDYLGILCQPGMETSVTAVLAEFLAGHDLGISCGDVRWDLLELSGVEAQERSIETLVEHMARQGCRIHRRPGPNFWRLALPATWEDYLAMLSKTHRHQIRRLQHKVFDSGQARLHTVETRDELPRAAEILADLHQRRWLAAGRPGCFASPRFAAFHQEVMPRLLASGQLQLHWLELDGRPVAAEYNLSGSGVVYVYQAGVEPDAMEHMPGRLITQATLRRAIQQGFRAFDWLRGDEPYKAHFRAQPYPSAVLRVVPNRATAKLRHRLWLAGYQVKQWMKPALRPTTSH